MIVGNLISTETGPETIQKHFDVSRESLEKLNAYANELVTWQSTINLIANSTIGQIWHRHISDGLQIHAYLSDHDRHIVDLGSGAGIPAVPLAIMLQEHNPEARVTMIESNAKKAAFLRHVSRICKIDTRIINARVESLKDSDLQRSIDVCTARALAPLPKLLDLAAQLPVRPQRMLFLKGQDVDAELTQATKCWKTSFTKHSSRTLKDGCVLEIHEAERVNTNDLSPKQR